MVAVAETWCWIYIVPKYMFKEKKKASDAIRIME